MNSKYILLHILLYLAVLGCSRTEAPTFVLYDEKDESSAVAVYAPEGMLAEHGITHEQYKEYVEFVYDALAYAIAEMIVKGLIGEDDESEDLPLKEPELPEGVTQVELNEIFKKTRIELWKLDENGDHTVEESYMGLLGNLVNAPSKPADGTSSTTITFHGPDPEWEFTDLTLPIKTSNTETVSFGRKHIHPFLAEFDRKLIVTLKGGKPQEGHLGRNTGGATKINVYLHEIERGSYLRLHDRHYEHLVDLTDGSVWLLKRVETAFYIGKADPDESNINFPVDTVTIFGKPARLFDGFKTTDTSKYIGCITSQDGKLGFYNLPEETF